MLDAFADALAGADAVAIADIWAGRDPDTTIASAAAPGRGRGGTPAATSRSSPRAASRRPRTRSPRRSDRATSCWSWAAAGQLPDRGAPARTPGGAADDRLRARPATCSRRTAAAWATFDGDAWVALFTEDAEYHEDPFGAPLVGHNALRAYLLDAPNRSATSSSRSNATGSRGSTVLAPGTRSLHGESDGRLERIAGFLTAELATDGRISRAARVVDGTLRRRAG